MTRTVRSKSEEAEAVSAAEQIFNENWRLEGTCAQTDPEAFYPEDERWSQPAKQVCAGCPVVAQCLAYALRSDERFGVWGGLTTAERQLVAAALQAPDGDETSERAA